MKEKCMNTRQNRLTEVYEYLRRYYGIHTKTDFAKAINYGRTSISAAFSGNEGYLTDSLFEHICRLYPVFNYDYLVTGDGQLIKEPDEPQSDQSNSEAKNVVTASPDTTKMYDALIEAKNETIQSLRQQLAGKDELLKTKDMLIASLRKQVGYCYGGDNEPPKMVSEP